MNLNGAIRRIQPLQMKLAGKLPVCPWSATFNCLDPRTLRGTPPLQDIDVIASEGTLKKLRFGNKHEAWFPHEAEITPEMWSEYLAVFWLHPSNGHRYVTKNTPIHPGDICLDCGSCEGFFAYQALEYGASKVVCVEPNPVMAECLRRTFSTEIAQRQIVVKEAALSSGCGTMDFTFDQLHPFGGKAGVTQASARSTVQTITVEELVSDLQLPALNVIKMDIEGGEIQAVEGALPLLRRAQPRLSITTYHRPFDYPALRAMLLSSGYRHVTHQGITDLGEGSASYRPMMLHAW